MSGAHDDEMHIAMAKVREQHYLLLSTLLTTHYSLLTTHYSLPTKVREQHGIEPNDFRHKEYFVPTKFGSCNWGGLGVVGCQNPLFASSTGRCRSK